MKRWQITVEDENGNFKNRNGGVLNLKQLRQFAGDDVAQDAVDDLALELQETRNALATREQVIKDQQALIESLSRQVDSKQKEIDSMTRELDDQNRRLEKIRELTI